MNPVRASMLKTTPTDLHSLKIAYSLKSPVGTPVSEDARIAVLDAVRFLRQQGFTVVEQDSPVDGVRMMKAYYLGALSDGSTANYLAQQKLHRNLTTADVTNNLVSPMTYALYEASRKAPRTIIQQYHAELELVGRQMAAFHEEYPIYLTPTTATVAPLNSDPAFLPADVQRLLKIKELPFEQQMQLIYEAWLHGLSKTPFTQLANISGEPALSLPTYVNAAGLPLGIQLEGTKGSDLILLAVGKLFEENHLFKFLNTYQMNQQRKGDCALVTNQKMTLGTMTEVPESTGSMIIHEINCRLVHFEDVHNQVLVKKAKSSSNQEILPQTGSRQNVAWILLGSLLMACVGLAEIGPKERHYNN